MELKVLKNEVWYDVPGYKGLYQISTLGRIKSCAKQVYSNGKKKYKTKEKIMKPRITKNGYCIVGLQLNKSSKTTYLHRMVAKMFISNPKNKSDVNHKDWDKKNNAVSNLEWATRSENKLHAFRGGFTTPVKGEKNGQSKLNTCKVRRIRSLWKTGGYQKKELGRMFSVSGETISSIIKRKLWRHVA